jgi:hypothetical protein
MKDKDKFKRDVTRKIAPEPKKLPPRPSIPEPPQAPSPQINHSHPPPDSNPSIPVLDRIQSIIDSYQDRFIDVPRNDQDSRLVVPRSGRIVVILVILVIVVAIAGMIKLMLHTTPTQNRANVGNHIHNSTDEGPKPTSVPDNKTPKAASTNITKNTTDDQTTIAPALKPKTKKTKSKRKRRKRKRKRK